MPQWTEDQLIIAIEFYYTCRENMHTDSHPMCKEIAALTNHTASALDRVLGNIKYADLGQAGLPHVSRKAQRLVDRYRNNPGALRADAARIRAANGWEILSVTIKMGVAAPEESRSVPPAVAGGLTSKM